LGGKASGNSRWSEFGIGTANAFLLEHQATQKRVSPAERIKHENEGIAVDAGSAGRGRGLSAGFEHRDAFFRGLGFRQKPIPFRIAA
jgi:hypothetical protein